MPTTELTPDAHQAIADRYFAEGSRLVDQATEYWNRTKDLTLDDVQRRGARLAYEQLSARARSCFKRHDMQLDLIAAEAVRPCARCRGPITDPENTPDDDSALCRDCGDPDDYPED